MSNILGYIHNFKEYNLERQIQLKARSYGVIYSERDCVFLHNLRNCSHGATGYCIDTYIGITHRNCTEWGV